MPEDLVESAIDRLILRHQNDRPAPGRQDARDIPQPDGIVLDMLEHVQANDVSTQTPQRSEIPQGPTDRSRWRRMLGRFWNRT